jgi:hypothetical protein
MTMTEQQKAQHLLTALLRLDTETFVGEVRHEHRTNQQLIMGKLFAVIDMMADAYTREAYDPRNETSCKISSAMSEAKQNMGYGPDDRLPYV